MDNLPSIAKDSLVFANDLTEEQRKYYEPVTVDDFERKQEPMNEATENFLEFINYVIEHESYEIFGNRVTKDDATGTLTLFLTIVITILQ